MLFGTQNHDGISKALGLHLPFFMVTTARLPHTVEYMYITSVGMMEGASFDRWGIFLEVHVAYYTWQCYRGRCAGRRVQLVGLSPL